VELEGATHFFKLQKAEAFYLVDAIYACMRRRVAAVWISLLIIVSSIVILVEIADRSTAPTTLYVGGGGLGNYSKIQWAIDNASDGDTVLVYDGTYYENIVINKTLTIIGNGSEYTIINANQTGDVVYIASDWVNVTGITVTGSGLLTGDAGIEINSSSNCKIENCNSSYNFIGLLLENSTDNLIANNTAFLNYIGSISLNRSNFNILSNNTVDFNKWKGVNITGVLGQWKMDEPSWNGTSDEVVDSSVFNNHGTSYSGADTTNVSKIGRAGSFDGQNDYVRVLHNESLDITGEFTIEAWVKAKGSKTYLCIVDKYRYNTSDSFSYGYTFYISAGRLRLSIYSGPNGIGNIVGSSELRDDNWHHVACTYNGSSMSLFVDGIMEISIPYNYAPASTLDNLGIGKRLSGWGGTLQFEGIMDELRIYNWSFSQDQMFFHYLSYQADLSQVAQIDLTNSHNNTLINNIVRSGLNKGINLYSSNDCTIYSNTISDNKAFGIFINGSSSNNLIFENIFYYNNGAGYDIYDPLHAQAYDGTSNNYWNSSTGQGNLWYDWLTPDSDGDGIVDNPYEIDGSVSFDNYPLSPFPSIVPNLQADSGDEYVYLTWNEPLYGGGLFGYSIISYKIYRGTVSGGLTLLTVMGNGLMYNDSAVTNGLTYYYAVSAVNNFGEGIQSSEVDAKPLGLPSEPQNLQIVMGNGYLNLSWDAPLDDGGSPVTGYNIYRNDTTVAYDTISANELWYLDNLVDGGIVYTYYVSAITSVGEGPLSIGLNEKAGMVPSEPTNLQANAGDSYIVLTWEAPISDGGYPITNYTIYRGEAQGGETDLVQIGNILSYNDTDVTNDVTYYYKVIALNNIGEGLFSQTVNATPKAIIIPINQIPTCSISSPITGSTIKGNIEINGTASDSDGEVQKVEIKIDDGNWIQVDGTTSWSYSLNTTSLSNDEHTLYVRAFDGTDYSSENHINILINNPSPESVEERSIFEELWLWAIIILIIIAILILILLTRRKKDKSETEIEKHEEPEEKVNEETDNTKIYEDEGDDIEDMGEEIIGD
jgi:parallel beta-helix repeat protein